MTDTELAERLEQLLFPNIVSSRNNTFLLDTIRQHLELGNRCEKALERLADAVYHAEVFHEAPQDVRVALHEAQQVLGL